MADINLVARVNIVCFTDIDYYGHAGVRLSQGHRLRLAQFSPFTFARLNLGWLPIGKLHEIEREVAFTPSLAPVSDHRRKKRAVLIGTTGITFALIPDCAADCIRRERCDHRIEKHGWTVWIIGAE